MKSSEAIFFFTILMGEVDKMGWSYATGLLALAKSYSLNLIDLSSKL
jgi:hypothetical protein